MNKFISDKQFAERYGLTRQWVWKQVKRDASFPRPIKFTDGCTRFDLDDVIAYEDRKRQTSL